MRSGFFLRLAPLTMALCFAGSTALAHPTGPETHIIHCLHGCPAGGAVDNDFIVRRAYALSSNDKTKLADWVAYLITDETVGRTGDKKRNWKKDPFLDADETLAPVDYRRAHAILGTDRGHQAPLAAFGGTHYWRETNYLSNITPQNSSLNRRPWRNLESAVRALVKNEKSAQVHVLTGPFYAENCWRAKRRLPNLPDKKSSCVPAGYWKVVAVGKEAKVAAFMFDNEATSRGYCAFRRNLSDIERRTGLDLFPHAPKNWIKGDLYRQLQCS